MSEATKGLAGLILESSKFLELEAKFVSILNDKSQLDAQWRSLDFNGNGIVSLAELDKWIVQSYPQLNNKAALIRAFARTTSKDGDGDDWVQRREFKALMVNVIYFNRAFELFDSIDTGRDQRVDFEEFFAAVSRLGLGLDRKLALVEFQRIDSNGGGQMLFDEFCEWLVDINSFKFKERMRGTAYVESIANGSGARAAAKPSPSAAPAPQPSSATRPTSARASDSSTHNVSPSPTASSSSPSSRPSSLHGSSKKQASPAPVVRSRALASAAGSPAASASAASISSAAAFDLVEAQFVRFISNREQLIAQWTMLDASSYGVVSFAAFRLWLSEQFPMLSDASALKLAFERVYTQVSCESAQLLFKDFGAILVNLLFFSRACSAYKDCGVSADQGMDLRDFKRILATLNMEMAHADALSQCALLHCSHSLIVLLIIRRVQVPLSGHQ